MVYRTRAVRGPLRGPRMEPNPGARMLALPSHRLTCTLHMGPRLSFTDSHPIVHLAYLWARATRNQKAAEQANLLLDSVLMGAWAAGMHFSLWPSVMLLSGVHLGNLSIGGFRLAWKGLVGVAIGALVVGWFTGFAT